MNDTRLPPVPPQVGPMTPDQIAARARATPAQPGYQTAGQAQEQIRPETPYSEQRRLESEGRLVPQAPALNVPSGAPQSSSAVSQGAVAAASGQPPPVAGQTRVVELEVPVQCSDGSVRTSVTLKRPKWGLFEEHLAHPLVVNKKLSANSAMVAACAGVPLDFMMELDFFDGMNLTNAVMDFFPPALRDRLQQLSSQSSPT